MKKIIILFLTILSFTAYAQDMQQYMRDTRKLVDDGKYPEALKRTIWFYDNAVQKAPAISAVRNSFALTDWKMLGEKYPPALKALKDTRDNKTKLAISKGDKDAFSDAVAINRTLGESKRSVELFKAMAAKHPDAARYCWFYVKKDLFDAKEYATIKQYIGSPSQEFETIKSHYNTMTGTLTKIPESARDRITNLTKTDFVNSTLKLIDYTLAVKDLKAARYVQQQALKVVKSDLIEKAVKS